jgi:succinate-semialdehyde dehydrogenase/glutarate-semialdehyde dehydrogenase
VGADSGKTIAVTDPATGETIAQVPDSGTEEARRAIDAAHDAFPAYAGLPLGERVKLMRKLHDAIHDNLEPMAQMLTAEQGKPLSESRAEVGSSAAMCCGLPKRRAARTARSSPRRSLPDAS